jgi:hypothetical protein
MVGNAQQWVVLKNVPPIVGFLMKQANAFVTNFVTEICAFCEQFRST